MTIIIFLIDTSASMNQRTYLGTTILDVAKGAVETFMKIRSRDPSSRWDRLMLLTFEDPPLNIKAGWKESHATFVQELKNLQASGLTTLGPALKHTFDLLNVNRMQSGIDTYGQGRCPFYLEPAIIICITDGKHLTSSSGVQSDLNLPMNFTVPGSELTKEPFRWDQRLFALVLRFPSVPPCENAVNQFIQPADDTAADVMCDVTGGRSFLVNSQRTLIQCLESLVQKAQPGVVINFEKIGPDPPEINKPDSEKDMNGNAKEGQNSTPGLPNGPSGLLMPGQAEIRRSLTPTQNSTAWHNCRKLIYVPRSAQKGYSVGHWPVPEAFWPDANDPSPTLPPRSSHPIVKFSCTSCEPMVIENLPFDKYEMEPSPLTRFILERRQPNVCWQVFVSNSAKYSDIGHPFGYLKASTNLNCVNLFVMPYNYPVLLPLLDELFKVHKCKPTQKWRQQFENYLKTMPLYYAAPLRRALGRMGAPNLVPDNMDNCMSYSVISYLKKLKNQAKMEFDRLVASVGQKTLQPEGIKVMSRSKTSVLQRPDLNQLLQAGGGDLGLLSTLLKQEINEFNTFTITTPCKDFKPQSFRNPFDIPRKELLDQIARMRSNFLQTSTAGSRLQNEDQIHSVPVQQMGNYQEYLKKMPPPLRELETQPVRLHMFGNPFKVNKNLTIDEADEAMLGQPARSNKQSPRSESPPGSPGPRKRKPGPLPRDIPIRRPRTPPVGTPANTTESEPPSPSLQENELPDTQEKSPINDKGNGLLSNHVEMMNHTPSDAEVAEYVPPVLKRQRLTSDMNSDQNNHQGTEAPPQMNNVRKESVINQHNQNLHHILCKELKKPGKNYDKFFGHLNTVQGSVDTKSLFIKDVIREAGRFKKKVLIQMLQQYEQSMLKVELKRQKNLNNIQKSPSR